MQNKVGTVALATLLASVLASCGGDGGSVPTLTPAPIPIPAPVPVATRYQAEAGTALIGRIDFFPAATIDYTATLFISFTNRQGVYFTGQTDRIRSGQSLAPDNDKPIYTLAAVGVDRASSIVVAVRAPIGSTVASPINGLIFATGDQPLVKRALQLDTGTYQLATDVDLRTESAVADFASTDTTVRSLGGRLTASNIRLLALASAVDVWRSGPNGTVDIPPQLTPASVDPIAEVLKAKPATRLYTDAGTEVLLRSVPQFSGNRGVYRDDVVAAAAHLINTYALAIGPVTVDTESAARYMLGIQGFLLPYLLELRQANTAAVAAAIQALTLNDVYAGTETYRAAPPPLSDNLSFPGPDFFRLAPGASRTVPKDDPFSNGSPSFGFNDVLFNASGPGSNGRDFTIDAVTVPASSAAALTAVLQPDQSVVIGAKPGFTGVAYFDYTSRRATGEVATGRVYVIVR